MNIVKPNLIEIRIVVGNKLTIQHILSTAIDMDTYT